MSNKIIGNPTREEILRKLIEQYGEGKWSEIARALLIHGIRIKRAIGLKKVWECMNPSLRKDMMPASQIQWLIKTGIECRGRRKLLMIKWFEKYGNERSSDLVMHYFKREVRQGFTQLSQIFCRKKKASKRYLNRLIYGAFRKFIQVRDIDSDDPFINEVKQSAVLVSELLIIYADHQFSYRSVQYEEYSKIAKKAQFEKAVEHARYINVLRQISDKSYYQDSEIIGKSLFLKETIADNKNTELFQKLFISKYWQSMYQKYLQAKDQDNHAYVYNPHQPLEDIKYPVNIIAVKSKKLRTVRGRIDINEKHQYQSNYSQNFKRDLLEVLKNEEEDSNPEQGDCIEKFTQLQSDQEDQEQIELEISRNKQLREQINKAVRKIKSNVYREYLKNNK